MNDVIGVLWDEAIQTALLGLVATVLGVGLQRLRLGWQAELAGRVVRAAVLHVYRKRVRAVKAANGGKLPENQRASVRHEARETARTMARRHGIEHATLDDDALLDEAIEREVREAKARAAAGRVWTPEAVRAHFEELYRRGVVRRPEGGGVAGRKRENEQG